MSRFIIDESVPLLVFDGEEWVEMPRRRRITRRFSVAVRRISKPKETK
jgi:hypothetical protein